MHRCYWWNPTNCYWLKLIFSKNCEFQSSKQFSKNHDKFYSDFEKFKGSANPNHFIFLKSMSEKVGSEIVYGTKNDSVIELLDQIDWGWRHWNSESSYVGSDSFRHWFKNKMGLNNPHLVSRGWKQKLSLIKIVKSQKLLLKTHLMCFWHNSKRWRRICSSCN